MKQCIIRIFCRSSLQPRALKTVLSIQPIRFICFSSSFSLSFSLITTFLYFVTAFRPNLCCCCYYSLEGRLERSPTVRSSYRSPVSVLGLSPTLALLEHFIQNARLHPSKRVVGIPLFNHSSNIDDTTTIIIPALAWIAWLGPWIAAIAIKPTQQSGS